MYWEVFSKEFKNSVAALNIHPPYKVEFTFIRSTKQKVDYIGPLESCQDIMQDFGWIENDDAYTLKPSLGDLEVDLEEDTPEQIENKLAEFYTIQYIKSGFILL